MLTVEKLSEWYEKHESQIIAQYKKFLNFKSISTDPACAGEIRKCAEWVAERLKGMGLKVEVWETKGHPVVFGSYEAGEGKPTVLIYHHYDVQPVDPLEKWKTPPFEPEVREGKMYARGASDNKGQCTYTLAALEAVLEMGGKLGVNVKVFVEGEEEHGSLGAFQVVEEKGERLKADSVLIVDGGIPADGVPGIALGLRGLLAMEVKCRNAEIDLHSGLHGGVVLNPNRALVQVLAKCWDEKGRIAIPGFYDGVEEGDLEGVSQELDVERLKKDFGVKAFQGEGGFSLWESNTVRPTLEINGLAGGYAGVGFKTVIPMEATAKISCRLVPGQEPHEVGGKVKAFLEREMPKGMVVEVTYDHGGMPVRTSAGTKLAELCAEVYSEVFGKECQKTLCGASVPLVADLGRVAGGDVVILGVALDTDDVHAPNEKFALERLKLGFLTMGRILGRLGC